MNTYKLIKLNKSIKNFRLKFLGLFLLHILKRRYLAIHFDPVNACNLRCKMCYFTDKDYVKKLKGIFPQDEIEYLGEAFFKRALKLQIGCGTEPTLYKNISKIVETASKYNVPNISLTTNANLLEMEKLEDWVSKGLSEIIISLHGVRKETYETMMAKGDFEKFMNSLSIISSLKKQYPLSLRVNYTFNEDNFSELSEFYNTFGKYDIDVLQIRPIIKLGNTEYNNFSLKKITPIYNEVLQGLIDDSKKHKVMLLAHNIHQINKRSSIDSVINKYVYCYISPSDLFDKKFKWKEDTYETYAKRVSIGKQIIRDAISSRSKILNYQNDKLNYEIN